jgi:uncharacterized protein
MAADGDVERVRRGYEAWNRGELDGFLELLHPDFAFRLSGTFPGLEREYHGAEGMRRFWSLMKEPWEELTVVPERFVEQEPHVLVLFRFRGLGRDGIRVERPFAHLLEMREGLALRLQAYADWDQGVEALERLRIS